MEAFCTLFDSGYLSRGLVLIDSLARVAPEARLIVYAADAEAERMLRRMRLANVDIVSLEDALDAEVRAVQPTRSRIEFLWTCTPVIVGDALRRFALPRCTYVDADMEFFSDPSVLLDEMGEGSVYITEHRYTPAYDQTASSGRFCVQFVAFRDDEAGRRVLASWRADCLAWCYARVEPGRFGDQKYLDKWPAMGPEVRIARHWGCGLAPWNIQQYSLHRAGGALLADHGPSGSRNVPVVFYHFHGLRFIGEDRLCLVPRYRIPADAKDLIYRPYVRALVGNEARIAREFPAPGGAREARKGGAVRAALREVQLRLSPNTYAIRDLVAG